MAFTHSVIRIDLQGVETEIGRFTVRQSFGATAMLLFRDYAQQNIPDARYVRDSTIAGRHYASQDGTVVCELH
jgi:hypothetical protein